MADAGVGEAMLLAETLGESYAVPGIMESSAAMLGESYAVPGIMPGTSSLMGGSSPYAMFGADMLGESYGVPGMLAGAAESPFAGYTSGMAEAGYPNMADMVGESYGVPGEVPGAPTSPYTNIPSPPGTQAVMDWLKSLPDYAKTDKLKEIWKDYKYPIMGLGIPMALRGMRTPPPPGTQPYSGPLSYFKYDPRQFAATAPTPPASPYRATYADGGITNIPTGPVERMSQNIVGAGGMYPQSQMEKTYFATPTQMPASAEVVGADYDARTNPYTGVMMAAGGKVSKQLTNEDVEKYVRDALERKQSSSQDKRDFLAQHNAALRSQGISAVDLAGGGIAALKEGSFVVPADVVSHMGNGSSDAGIAELSKRTGAKPIKGGGDGMSDSIATSIEGRQQARVADGEAVIEPDQVKKIGKGSSEKGAKKLYDMMDKVRKARTGTTKQGKQINPAKYIPT